jgi:hypothetical protein
MRCSPATIVCRVAICFAMFASEAVRHKNLERGGEAVLDLLSCRLPVTDQLLVVFEYAGICLSGVRSPGCRSSSITAAI